MLNAFVVGGVFLVVALGIFLVNYKAKEGVLKGLTAVVGAIGSAVLLFSQAEITATNATALIRSDEIVISSQLPDFLDCFVDIIYTVDDSAYENGNEYVSPIVVGEVCNGDSEITVSFYHRFLWVIKGRTFERTYEIRPQSVDWVDEYPDFDPDLNHTIVRFDKHKICGVIAKHDRITDGEPEPTDDTMVEFDPDSGAVIGFYDSNGQPFRKIFFEDVKNVSCVVVSYNDESYNFNVKEQSENDNNILEINLNISGEVVTDSIEILLIPFDENEEIRVNNILFDRYISRYN